MYKWSKMISRHGQSLFSHPRGTRPNYASAGRLAADRGQIDGIVEEEGAARGILAGQLQQILDEVVGSRTAGTEAGFFDPEGDGEAAGLANFELQTKAGQLNHLVVDLRVEVFRGLGSLQRAANNV